MSKEGYIGFDPDNQYVGYFSSLEMAKEENCTSIIPLNPDFIGDDGVIFFITIDVETYFDDAFQIFEISRSEKENIQKISEYMSVEGLQRICDAYLAALPQEDKDALGEYIEPENLLSNINILNGVAYPYEH